jgi:hypothetical protein
VTGSRNNVHTPLARIIEEELAQPVPAEALALATAIRQRHGAAVTAILFYGSCLRTRNVEDGVLDFYVLVDSYRAAYSSLVLRWLNALLPPNVFYLEGRDGQKTIRAKYAVIANDDFAQAATLQSIPAIIWARFCQPVRLVYLRDEHIRLVLVHSLVESTMTMVTRALALLPVSGDVVRFQPEALWQQGFVETYKTEFRAERLETIQQLYRAAPDRYDRVALEALRVLEQRRMVRVLAEDSPLCVSIATRQHRLLQRSWSMRRSLAKALYAVRLLKSVTTFTDWFPYVLWKLERHTGVHIEPSKQQRKHPFLLGGPLILKLLLKGNFR